MDIGSGAAIAGTMVAFAAVAITVIKTKNGNGTKKYVLKETCVVTQGGLKTQMESMSGNINDVKDTVNKLLEIQLGN